MSLPSWAQFFLALGSAIAAFSPEVDRSITAVTVPVSRFAGVLTATGYLMKTQSGSALEEHINFYRRLEPGRQVWYSGETKRIKALYDGIETRNDMEFLRIGIKKGRGSFYQLVPLNQSQKIQLASNNVPVKRSSYIDKVPMTEFASSALGAEARKSVSERSGIETVIVGQKNTIGPDITRDMFSICQNGTLVSGHLQEILRTIEFGDTRDDHGFASRVETPYSISNTYHESPNFVVFNGERASSLGRLRHSTAKHWMVVLDRTSRRFVEACDLVDNMFINRAGIVDPEDLPTPPEGIELSSFIRGT